jgi:hypothetical protein
MININESQISKNIGNTGRSSIWNEKRREIIHHSLEIVLKDIQLLESLK